MAKGDSNNEVLVMGRIMPTEGCVSAMQQFVPAARQSCYVLAPSAKPRHYFGWHVMTQRRVEPVAAPICLCMQGHE